MAQRQKQHYVPKLLLKKFSVANNLKQIHLYNFQNDKFIRNAPIKSQSQENFFYGKDALVEEGFSELEDKAAPVIREIISTESLPKKDTDQYAALIVFLGLLCYRTKGKARYTEELMDTFFNTIISKDVRLKNLAFKYKITSENAVIQNLRSVYRSLPMVYDLEMKLLINTSQWPFILSDDPVVACNQFMEKRRHPGGWVGLGSKGLQLFCPLSPRYTLLLYDRKIYKVGNKKDLSVKLNNYEDIYQLNFLQAIYCNANIYFNEELSESELLKISKVAKAKRAEMEVPIKETPIETDPDGTKSQLIYHIGRGLITNLKLQFVKETSHAKKLKLTDTVELRNHAENFISSRHENPDL